MKNVEDAGWHVRAHLERMGEALAQVLARTNGGETPAAQARAPARAWIDERARQAGSSIYLPLGHVTRAFALEPIELDALVLALAVEVDAQLAHTVAVLNGARPSLGLAQTVAAGAGGPSIPELRDRPMWRDALVEIDGDGPLPTRTLRLTGDVRRRLLASHFLPPDAPGVELHPLIRDAGKLVVSEALDRQLSAWTRVAQRPPPQQPITAPPLLLVGENGSGRSTLARRHVGLAGYALVEVQLTIETLPERVRAARREARWHHAALLLRVPPGLGEEAARGLWQRLRGLAGPLVLALAPADLDTLRRAAPVAPVCVRLERPTLAERAELWARLQPPGATLASGEADALAARFQFVPGDIAASVARASINAGARPGEPGRPDASQLALAARELGAARMSRLARRLPTPYTRDHLVVAPHVHAELGLAVAWVQKKRRVLDDWGFAARLPLGHGLTALFAGPPGTGKTMAAQVLARELDCDLFRVDLSRVMSKYIGETEKNLAQLFDESQAAGAVLFFDEAEALFGKRSESSNAHDRYANVEIGYLLQRMEEHDGVTILATNRQGDMDEAFLRRFHIVAKFEPPGAQERLRIWEGMLPPALARTPDLPIAHVARAFELSGGEIKNAALASAFLAAAEDSPLAARHLVRAIERELLKAGRVFDPQELAQLARA